MKPRIDHLQALSNQKSVDNLPGFSRLVTDLVYAIPSGKVMTYGQIASICGNPRAARIVGGIAHYGDSNLPWQRVVNKSGGLAVGYPGGIEGHKLALEAEDIVFNKDLLDLGEYQWHPSQDL